MGSKWPSWVVSCIIRPFHAWMVLLLWKGVGEAERHTHTDTHTQGMECKKLSHLSVNHMYFIGAMGKARDLCKWCTYPPYYCHALCTCAGPFLSCRLLVLTATFLLPLALLGCSWPTSGKLHFSCLASRVTRSGIPSHVGSFLYCWCRCFANARVVSPAVSALGIRHQNRTSLVAVQIPGCKRGRQRKCVVMLVNSLVCFFVDQNSFE